MQKRFTQESTSFGCWSVPKYQTSSDTSLSLRPKFEFLQEAQ
jgi:hypothetical protein